MTNRLNMRSSSFALLQLISFRFRLQKFYIMGNFSNGEKPTIWGSHGKLNMESSCNLGNYEKTCIVGNSWKKTVNPTIWGNPERRICCDKNRSGNYLGNSLDCCLYKY